MIAQSHEYTIKHCTFWINFIVCDMSQKKKKVSLLKNGKGIRVESGLRSHLVKSILLRFRNWSPEGFSGGLPKEAQMFRGWWETRSQVSWVLGWGLVPNREDSSNILAAHRALALPSRLKGGLSLQEWWGSECTWAKHHPRVLLITHSAGVYWNLP